MGQTFGMAQKPALHSQQTLRVHEADAILATDGVARGDPISFADELVLDDLYQVRHRAMHGRLTLQTNAAGTGFEISAISQLGTGGNMVVVDCCITLLAPDSSMREALVLVEVERDGVEGVYVLPILPLQPGMIYRLARVDRHAAMARFIQVPCVSFVRGTHITVASGRQVAIEALKVGDQVLTRDAGPQTVRWVGQSTHPARVPYAPVVIRAGALHNTHDLIVSPNHRLFIYPRQDTAGADRKAVSVKAGDLVNGDSIYQADETTLQYIQLLFDDHQIVYAEGVATEAVLIAPTQAPANDSAT